MASELRHLDVTGKTYNCTVSLNGGAATTPTVSETSGVYTADYTNASTGTLMILWDNTTDSIQHRQYWYWDGSSIQLTQPAITSQAVRDAMKLAHTNGNPGIDAMLSNIETGVL